VSAQTGPFETPLGTPLTERFAHAKAVVFAEVLDSTFPAPPQSADTSEAGPESYTATLEVRRTWKGELSPGALIAVGTPRICGGKCFWYPFKVGEEVVLFINHSGDPAALGLFDDVIGGDLVKHAIPVFDALATSPAPNQTSDVPHALKQSAECMLKVLKTVLGVSEPKLGYATSEGWNHPFLEYRAEERNSWGKPMRFEAQKKVIPHQYWFLAITSGRVLPDIGHVDIHVTEAVMQQWKAQCNVDANVLFP
jgi:hypothetical protein